MPTFRPADRHPRPPRPPCPLAARVVLLLAALGSPTAASAFTFDAVVESPLASTPVDLTVYGASDPAAFIAEAGGWETVGSDDTDVPDAAATAVSGADQLWMCSGGTLWLWLGPGAGDAIPVGDPCAALQARDDRVLTRAPTGDDGTPGTLLLRVTDGSSAVDVGVSPDLFAVAPEAESGAPIAWANLGDTSITQRDSFGDSNFSTSNPITALDWGTTDWVVGGSLGFRELGGGQSGSLPSPTQVGAADFDADGVDELWAFDGATLMVVGGETVALPFPADRIAIGDLDGDSCADVTGIRADEAGGVLLTASVFNCPGRTDDDGDGYLPFGDNPDCAPDDPTIHPDAPETCDGVDQDCDGDVDEISVVALDTPVAEEGTLFSITATTDGCGEDSPGLTIWDWQFMGEAECQGDNASANCLSLDDGDLTASLTLTLPNGTVTSAETAVRVSNLAPYLLDANIDWGTHTEATLNELNLAANERLEVQLVAGDPGLDTVTFSSPTTGMPVELTEAGLLTITGGTTVLDFAYTVVLTDDDGGSSDHVFTIRVGTTPQDNEPVTTPTDTGLCCTIPLASGLWMLSALLRKKP